MEVSGQTKVKSYSKIKEAVFSVETIIDYEQPIKTIEKKYFKEVSDDIFKVKIKASGKKSVCIFLLDLGSRISEREAKEKMNVLGIKQAGLHETLYFSQHLGELPENIHITSLREEMIERSVEFVPTIIKNKKSTIGMSFRDDLPFKHTYFLGIREM